MRRFAARLLTAILATSAAAAPAADADDRCLALGALDLSGLPDAPAQITGAARVPASDALPARCRVEGYVAPAVGFLLLLPESDWNGKFMKRGCGGFCGSALEPACDEPVARGYACLVSDMGHRSTPFDGKWAYGAREAEIDFGYRATHVTAVAGKALVRAFYGEPARLAYYQGCSTGGRQGFVAAQRFPGDFNGIIAGAPVIDETGAGMQLLWSVLELQDATGAPLLDRAAIEALNAAVVAACDREDGLADGIIGDPRRCAFDPATLACSRGEADGCLTARQVEAVRRVYDGPVDGSGRRLYTAGAPRGSELRWLGNYLGVDGRRPLYEGFIADLFRYLAFSEDPGPAWNPRDFDWDRDPARLGAMETLYSGSNPDLRRFRDAGGKMLVYQGWNDYSVVPGNVVDYFDTARATMGGEASLGRFFRLFMMPGMEHCTGGVGADAVDWIGALEDWVERGIAPDRLVAYKLAPQVASPRGIQRFPPEAGSVRFSRPLFPHPARAVYGGGDPADHSSFRPARD